MSKEDGPWGPSKEAFPASEETKKWAMEKGFYPGRVELYGLTEENYKNWTYDKNEYPEMPEIIFD